MKDALDNDKTLGAVADAVTEIHKHDAANLPTIVTNPATERPGLPLYILIAAAAVILINNYYKLKLPCDAATKSPPSEP
jgi:hypothetical protein